MPQFIIAQPFNPYKTMNWCFLMLGSKLEQPALRDNNVQGGSVAMKTT